MVRDGHDGHGGHGGQAGRLGQMGQMGQSTFFRDKGGYGWQNVKERCAEKAVAKIVGYMVENKLKK